MGTKLLLAEDEPGLSRALGMILQRNSYDVDIVADGLSAYEYLKTGIYDIAVLDIMMPGIDGVEVVRRARAHSIAIPIIMLTAKGEISDRVEGLDAGANDYLVKPFAAQELLARLRALLRSSAALDVTVLAFGNIELDRNAGTLSGPDGQERLSNRELQILEIFMAHPRQVFSTTHLLEGVWGYDALEDSNVVWVYLSYVRKKLSAVGADVCIHSYRGRGYSLELDASQADAGGR